MLKRLIKYDSDMHLHQLELINFFILIFIGSRLSRWIVRFRCWVRCGASGTERWWSFSVITVHPYKFKTLNEAESGGPHNRGTGTMRLSSSPGHIRTLGFHYAPRDPPPRADLIRLCLSF